MSSNQKMISPECYTNFTVEIFISWLLKAVNNVPLEESILGRAENDMHICQISAFHFLSNLQLFVIRDFF